MYVSAVAELRSLTAYVDSRASFYGAAWCAPRDDGFITLRAWPAVDGSDDHGSIDRSTSLLVLTTIMYTRDYCNQP